MPGDRLRLPLPEDTYDATNFQEESGNGTKEPKVRSDDRKEGELRAVFLRTKVITQAKGSAYIELGNTKIISAVYGPHEMQGHEGFSSCGRLSCDFKYATFSCPKRRGHQSDSQEKDYSLILQEALEPAVCLHKFPKAQVDVFVIVLQNDGSELAAAFTCASAALADANLDMYGIVIGCALHNTLDACLVDPVLSEVTSAPGHSNMIVGYMPALNQISALVQNGEMDHAMAQQSIKVCISSCHKYYMLVRNALLKTLKQTGSSIL